MTCDLSLIPEEQFIVIETEMLNNFYDNSDLLPYYIKRKEDVFIITQFLEEIILNDKNWFFKIVDETSRNVLSFDTRSKFKKSILTIAKDEQINKVRGINTSTSGAKRLGKYVSAAYPDKNDQEKKRIYYMGKAIYNKERMLLHSRINRVKDSTKAKALIEKYPHLPILRIIQLGILKGKLELTVDDISWMEQTIDLLEGFKHL